jgi:hypothetical protein
MHCDTWKVCLGYQSKHIPQIRVSKIRAPRNHNMRAFKIERPEPDFIESGSGRV